MLNNEVNRLFYRPGVDQRFSFSIRLKADALQKAQRDNKVCKRFALMNEAPPPPSIKFDFWLKGAQNMDYVFDFSSYWPVFDNHRLKVFACGYDETRNQVETEDLTR